MDPLCPLDVQKDDVEGLHEVVNLLQEVLLTVLLHVVLLLLESCCSLVELQLGCESIDQHREHLVMSLNISEWQIRTQRRGLVIVDILGFSDDLFDLIEGKHGLDD